MPQSVEPLVSDEITAKLKDYGLSYELEGESLNDDIDRALLKYSSKGGGQGGNRPDVKLFAYDKYGKRYPVIIEFKGYKDKLVKYDENGNVQNRNEKNQTYISNIKNYAVNGAVHYADAILHYTMYHEIIAIGITGYKNATGKLCLEYGVFYVSDDNFGVGEKVDEYTDLSFLKKENFDTFLNKIKDLRLTLVEQENIRQKRESEITTSLTKLNNDIYKNEKGLGESQRVYLVAAAIMATLGIEDKVPPLEIDELKSLNQKGDRDGDIVMRKISAFLDEKALPNEKKDLIIKTLDKTITDENINKVENGETQLKRVFRKIYDDLGFYYKLGLTTDFTGKLFNEMYSWLGWSQDKMNDVVLTPSYIGTLLVKLARVDKDSYVWDYACGSGGLLVAAMNEMIDDARNKIKSPDELTEKTNHIREKQLLGIEILPEIYILAVLNMILMGDGSSNMINTDSLLDYNGKYGYGNTNEDFPATAFVLNPPYSADGKGMVFVEKALSMMKSGYAAIIIQSSAGGGKAVEYNRRILKHNTLLASIKMPADLFIGKSTVQTNIYVFRVNEPHDKDFVVKFIDFTNDGYTRTNRKKASINLKDTGNAAERYQEIVDLVKYGKEKLNLFSDEEYYEGHIDPLNGADWNQRGPIKNIQPGINDVKHCINDYLSWEILSVIYPESDEGIPDRKIETPLEQKLKQVQWGRFKVNQLFTGSVGDVDIQKKDINGKGTIVITSGLNNNGILGRSDVEAKIFDSNTITIDMFGNVFYRPFEYKLVTHARVFSLKPKFPVTQSQVLFLASSFHFLSKTFEYNQMCSWEKIKDLDIILPVNDRGLDFNFMDFCVRELEEENISELEMHFDRFGLENSSITNHKK